MAFEGLRIGEGGFSELELQESFALGGGSWWTLPENLQEQPLKAGGAGENLDLSSASGLEMFLLGPPVGIIEGHPAIKGLEAPDGCLQHGIPVPGGGFHCDAGTGIMPEVVFEMLDQNRLALSLHHDERGVPRGAWFAFRGI